MNSNSWRNWCGAVWLCLSSGVAAESIEQLPSPLPDSYVSDHKQLLAADSRAELDRLAASLDQSRRGQLAIVVIASTDGMEPRRYATELFNRWGVGDRQRNDGSLILLAKQDRAAEIVLGVGIDNPTNRGHAEAVMQGAMVPRFRQANFDLGLIDGATALLQSIYTLDLSQPAESPVNGSTADSSLAADAAAQALIDGDATTLVDSGPLASQTPRPIPAASSEPRTDYTALALGGSAALGAGVGVLWAIYRFLLMLWWFTGSRWFVRRCPCGQTMQLLSEVDDDAHLDPTQRTEERLGSVDHRVYRCPACSQVQEFSRRAWFSRYSDCRSCRSRALQSKSETLKSATRSSTGLALISTDCQHCGKKTSERRVLPVLPPPSSSSSGSSSRSFGGGRSSGGGSSGRW